MTRPRKPSAASIERALVRWHKEGIAYYRSALTSVADRQLYRIAARLAAGSKGEGK